MNSFLSELRRRNVIRMAGLYLVGAWLLVQVAGTVLPMFAVPEWVARAIVIVLALGFVPALVFSWVFELTPGGLKRDEEVPHGQSIAPQTARRMDRMIVIGLLAVVALFAADRFWLRGERERGSESVSGSGDAVQAKSESPESDSDPLSVPVPIAADSKTIAVLPFSDFSPGGDQQWFADGLSEEILNALTRTPDLRVSARTSSFRYKGSTLGIPKIAAELGVAHVLEGSVRSTPQRIRVTAQLIRAADGFHVWSENYDREVADMIEIQEDLARQIATAMQTSMDPEALADMAQVGTRSVEAYQAYIRGVAKSILQEPADFKLAYELFEQARGLDPTFAGAHARAAAFWLEQLDPTTTLSDLTDLAPLEMGRLFNERIDLAIRHASSEIDRTGYRALKASRDLRLREATRLHRAFFAKRPGDLEAANRLLRGASYASDQAVLTQTLDAIWPQAQRRPEFALAHVTSAYRRLDKRKAADQALVLFQRWPEQRTLLYQIHRALLWDNRVEQAAAVLERWQTLAGDESQWLPIPPARQACAEGRRAEVENALAQLANDDLAPRWHLLTLLGRSADAVELLQPLEREGNTYALAGFLVYPNFDPTPFPSLMQVLEREKIKRPPPLALPYACPPAKPGS